MIQQFEPTFKSKYNESKSDNNNKKIFHHGDERYSNTIYKENCDDEGTIFQLANIFLSIKCMTNKKLQKLCYYAQAWHLALEDAPLIECDFEAWVHGPVCAELYRKYSRHGYNDIPLYVSDEQQTNEEIRTFARDVFDAYGDLTGNELEKLTHKEEPWIIARGDLKPWESCDNIISEESMKEYYRKL